MLSRCHLTVGRGFPVTWQSNWTREPTGAWTLSGERTISGDTAKNNTSNNHNNNNNIIGVDDDDVKFDNDDGKAVVHVVVAILNLPLVSTVSLAEADRLPPRLSATHS